MVNASAVPNEFVNLQQSDACYSPSNYIDTTQVGWQTVNYMVASAGTQLDAIDVAESLAALREGPGIDLETLRQELGA